METGVKDLHHLTACRRHLVAMEIALKQAKDEYDQIKVYRERKVIAELNGSAGRNDDERKRNLAVALAEDTVYQQALGQLRDAEADVATAQVELEIASDQRRAEEWQIRALLVQALFESRVNSAQPGDDQSFDDVLIETATRKTYDATARAYREANELFS